MRFSLAMVAVVVLALAGAHADSPDWQWNFMHRAYFGAHLQALDDYDGMDVLEGGAVLSHVASYQQQGVGSWTGPTGLYGRDVRAPFTGAIGESKTWTIYLWGDAYLVPGATFLSLSWFGDSVPKTILEHVEFRLTFVRPAAGIADAWLPVGTSVLLNEHTESGWIFPIYRTENGLDGYIFELTATVIPEPSAFIALGVGLAALGIRRRRDTDVPRNSGGGHG